uniref:leucine-rich repeat-containing protein 51-like isoform X1 n=1 Tax=Styela clava TaxID=7725 RepID=UPI0019398981|nr:leucine-rich repeat-containing protein 51-like isoform X1 [Styela clava]
MAASVASKSSVRRASLKSTTSYKQALHEILANMQPEEDMDVAHKSGPPVDFTFRDLRAVTDICKVDPREGPNKYVKIEVKRKNENDEEPLFPDDNDKKNDEPRQFYKYCSKAIKLGNNSLARLENFSSGLQAVLEDPESIEWIDLSFNDLTKIDNVILEYPNLKVLYLHANYIDDLKQVDKLAALPHLKTLTLHGNMIEGKKGYRQYVIMTIPQLQYFDFSRITKADRDKAQVWRKLKLIESTTHKKKPKAAEA